MPYPGYPTLAPQPVTPNKPVSSGIFSSPLVEHESFIDDDGLLTFCKWCEQEYKIKPEPFLDSPFDETYRKLQEHCITINVLGGKSADWYKNEGVASGTAERMAKSFPKWRAQLRK